MKPPTVKSVSEAAGWALLGVALRRGARHLGRRGVKAEPRVAVGIVFVDALVTLVLEIRKRRAKE